MAEKLTFALVSPDRELVHDQVDHVIVPGAEGEFGVLARHAPFMAVVKQGPLRILKDGAERRFFVNGGFADVTPEGLTVLAEDAVELAGLDAAAIDQQIKDAAEDVQGAGDDAKRASAEAKLARLEALRRAL